MNAIIGDNGIITKAQEAKKLSEETSKKEEMEMILLEYNSDETLGRSNGFTNYLKNLKDEGKIEEYFPVNGQIVVKYKGTSYYIVQNGDYYKLGQKVSTDLGENKEGGNYLISTENADEAGELEFTVGSTYTIMDEIKTEGFNFVIPDAEGKTENAVTMHILSDITIDNKGYERSAIQLLPGAILNLHIDEGVKVTVNSGYGASGEVAEGFGAKGGPGGYAGIEVPETATLNLYGNGQITCIGGDAGNGAGAVSRNTGGRRWRRSWSWYRR